MPREPAPQEPTASEKQSSGSHNGTNNPGVTKNRNVMCLHVAQRRSFHRRRKRDEDGKALVEGHRLVCDLIEGGHAPDLVIVTPEVSSKPIAFI